MEFNQEEGLNHTAYSETEMQAFANFLFVHFPTAVPVDRILLIVPP
jgi:hypothetical protein